MLCRPNARGPGRRRSAVQLAETALAMSPRREAPNCLISGGEPTVQAGAPRRARQGGRNQQLVLAAVDVWPDEQVARRSAVILSGGTDGEDGPTDAAGAMVDRAISGPRRPERAANRGLPRPQRRLSFFRAARRADQDRAHAHERLRRSRGGRRAGGRLESRPWRVAPGTRSNRSCARTCDGFSFDGGGPQEIRKGTKKDAIAAS